MVHVKFEGLRPRVHGNTYRKPKHALAHSSIQYVVRFLYIYAEQHALLLPGRVPGYSRTDIQLLPSSVSKRSVWIVYKEAAQAVSEVHTVSYSHPYRYSASAINRQQEECVDCLQGSSSSSE